MPEAEPVFISAEMTKILGLECNIPTNWKFG